MNQDQDLKESPDLIERLRKRFGQQFDDLMKALESGNYDAPPCPYICRRDHCPCLEKKR